VNQAGSGSISGQAGRCGIGYFQQLANAKLKGQIASHIVISHSRKRL